MKNAVKLNRLLLKLILLFQVGIQESSSEGNAEFNFRRITWESKRALKVHFSGFQRV